MYIVLNYKINFHFGKTISLLLLVGINNVLVFYNIKKESISIHDLLKFIHGVSCKKAFQDLLCIFLLWKGYTINKNKVDVSIKFLLM